jgi:hypothetical protein
MYQSKVRSIDIDAPSDCAFRHPDASRGGRWYGRCVNGLGGGTGRGFVRRDDGRGIEYYGQASNGVASGVGYMSVNGGSVVYEGEFANGRPNGAVLVSGPGEKPHARTFANGEDVGGAEEESVPRL